MRKESWYAKKYDKQNYEKWREAMQKEAQNSYQVPIGISKIFQEKFSMEFIKESEWKSNWIFLDFEIGGRNSYWIFVEFRIFLVKRRLMFIWMGVFISYGCVIPNFHHYFSWLIPPGKWNLRPKVEFFKNSWHVFFSTKTHVGTFLCLNIGYDFVSVSFHFRSWLLMSFSP